MTHLRSTSTQHSGGMLAAVFFQLLSLPEHGVIRVLPHQVDSRGRVLSVAGHEGVGLSQSMLTLTVELELQAAPEELFGAATDAAATDVARSAARAPRSIAPRATHSVVLTRSSLTRGGPRSWHGLSSAGEHGTFVFVDGGQHVAGSVNTESSIFSVDGAVDGAVDVRSRDYTDYPDEACFHEHEHEHDEQHEHNEHGAHDEQHGRNEPLDRQPPRRKLEQTSAEAEAAALEGEEHAEELPGEIYTIDVMIAYTTKAKCDCATGSESCADSTSKSCIEAKAELAVAETNIAFETSGVSARVELVLTYEVEYAESDSFSTMLADLQYGRIGVNSEIFYHRERVGADVVALFVANGEYCGIGNMHSTFDSAFQVVCWTCATGYYSFGHERELSHPACVGPTPPSHTRLPFAQLGTTWAPGTTISPTTSTAALSTGLRPRRGSTAAMFTLTATGTRCARALSNPVHSYLRCPPPPPLQPFSVGSSSVCSVAAGHDNAGTSRVGAVHTICTALSWPTAATTTSAPVVNVSSSSRIHSGTTRTRTSVPW